MSPVAITKGRFLMALECPRRLNYASDPRYVDASADSEFMQPLAEGGHQIGELARRMFPGGHLVTEASADDQVRVTGSMLSSRSATVFEGTIRHGNLLARCDVLRKADNRLELYEVKAKGFNWQKDKLLSAKNGAHPVVSGWRPYIYDVAFQAYVLNLAYPRLEIVPHLLLLDKNSRVSFSGLNTLFAVRTDGKHVRITVDPSFDVLALQPAILRVLGVSDAISAVREYPIGVLGREQTFEEFVSEIAASLEKSELLPARLSAKCKRCPYYAEPDHLTHGERSGWTECMQRTHGASAPRKRNETVFSLHRLSRARLEDLLATQPLDLGSIAENALPADAEWTDEITLDKRRRLQWLEARGELREPFVHADACHAGMKGWRWPLHFIDFETTRPALPYHNDRTPYDQILFQFSHHVLDKNERVEHRSQYLDATPDVAPSFRVLRMLREALSADNGTVLHWWTHEDTVLKEIKEQLLLDKPEDHLQLIEFVDSLVGSNKEAGRLIDLGRLVSKTAFYPGTNGSSSIKRVLPAALTHTPWLRQRYRAPVYGTTRLPSLNFANWQWVIEDNGAVLDPYSLLNPLFADAAIEKAVQKAEDEDSVNEGLFISNGGAAIIAYDQLQHRDLPDAERHRLTTQLLRYCELDTFAMVIVYQALTGLGRCV